MGYQVMHHDDGETVEVATIGEAKAVIARRHNRHPVEVGIDDRSSGGGTYLRYDAWLAGRGDHGDPVATITESTEPAVELELGRDEQVTGLDQDPCSNPECPKRIDGAAEHVDGACDASWPLLHTQLAAPGHKDRQGTTCQCGRQHATIAELELHQIRPWLGAEAPYQTGPRRGQQIAAKRKA